MRYNRTQERAGLKESDIQATIRDFLRFHGFFVYKNHQSLGSYPGVADLTAIKDGTVFWIEVKKPKTGRLSEAQKRFASAIKNHGGNFFVATSIEDVMENIPGLRGLFETQESER